MRCSSRPSRAKKTGAARSLVRAIALGFVLLLAVAASSAQAQSPTPRPTPTPTPTPSPTPIPTPSPTPTFIHSDVSAGATATNPGSNFLERLGDQAANGFGSPS